MHIYHPYSHLGGPDASNAMQVISLLHQRYAEFSGELIAKLNDVFVPGAGGRLSSTVPPSLLHLITHILSSSILFTCHIL